MEQPRRDFNNLPETPLLDEANQALRAGEEGKFRRAGDDDLWMLVNGFEDGAVRRKVNAEGLLAKQVLTRLDDVDV